MNNVEAYNKLNRSFKKKFIFNFGSEAGFYSEFNNMVFAIVYCLKYKYKFILYSDSCTFKINKGWEDFFEPFCDSLGSSSFHKKFNKRTLAPFISRRDYPTWYTYKLFNRNTYLTYQLFNSFYNSKFEKEDFNFPELGIKGNLREVSREIVNMIYKFNNTTKKEIQKISSRLNLPTKYIALNIRRGDKDTEYKFVTTDKYIDKLKERSNLYEIFVLSDDYTVIESLQKTHSDLHLYTLVSKEERGYIHDDFLKLSPSEMKEKLINLFTSIEIICNAELAIGTYTTNPGLFIGMKMPKDKFISVQKSSWYQFELDDIENFIVK